MTIPLHQANLIPKKWVPLNDSLLLVASKNEWFWKNPKDPGMS